MSVIWGCIDFSGGEAAARMGSPVCGDGIDRTEELRGRGVVMGCGLQYVMPESDRERLPWRDGEGELYFTADCIVDNREELIPLLCPDAPDTPDGGLLLLAYREWGEDTPRQVYGSYAFAAYHAKENRLVLCVDHTFSRCLYYSRVGSRLYFGTLLSSILAVQQTPPKFNQPELALLMSGPGLSMYHDAESTFYENVYRIPAGHYLRISKSQTRSVCYWSPKDVQPLRLKDDAAYGDYFRNLMETVTRQMTRSSGEVGMLLSCGLDSTSVAAFAAGHLARSGRKLHAYTYVPMADYASKVNPKRILTNERQGVEAFAARYPNIQTRFCDFPDRNGIGETKRLQDRLELPYVTHTNLPWLDGFAEMAAKEGCRVMLTGQMGNATISGGEMTPYVVSRILKGRWIDAARNINRYGQTMWIGRKGFAKYVLQNLPPKWLQWLTTPDYFKDFPLNRDYLRHLGIRKRDPRYSFRAGVIGTFSYRKERSLIYSPVSLGQVGELETKTYLRYGMVTRDPTKDIRIFEFCLSVPMECLVGHGNQTRRLVRRYLSDLLPPELIEERAPRGRQSGDWHDRLLKDWDRVYSELNRVLTGPALAPYLDAPAVSRLLSRLKESDDTRLFNQLFKFYSAGLFMENQGERRSGR